jgi:hypothetical protein
LGWGEVLVGWDVAVVELEVRVEELIAVLAAAEVLKVVFARMGSRMVN